MACNAFSERENYIYLCFILKRILCRTCFGTGFFLFNRKGYLIYLIMSDVVYFTAEGLKKLKKEIDHLKSVERPNLSKQIAEARDKGDLSENAEYDAAKEAQGLLELKISKLEAQIRNARVIEESKIDTSKVQLLTKVKIKNTKNGAEMVYAIVPESDANLKEAKISVNTPIAQGLMGKKIGDIADIKVPAGTIPFEIIDITL